MIPGNDRLIIIIGMAHSGTTILAHILKQHPDVRLFVDGTEAWLHENTWLPCEKSDCIENALSQCPDKRPLLKRPRNTVSHADWMAADMPKARYLCTLRPFDEISKSWSNMRTSFMEREIKASVEKQWEHYQLCLNSAKSFSSKVTYFRWVKLNEFVADPQGVMQELTSWLNLTPFVFDTSWVSENKNIKQHLWLTWHRRDGK